MISEGEFVIGTFRHLEQVEAFRNLHAGKGYAFQLDLHHAAGLEKVAQEVQHRFGWIDVLVNNAGSGFAGAIEEASPTEPKKYIIIRARTGTRPYDYSCRTWRR